MQCFVCWCVGCFLIGSLFLCEWIMLVVSSKQTTNNHYIKNNNEHTKSNKENPTTNNKQQTINNDSKQRWRKMTRLGAMDKFGQVATAFMHWPWQCLLCVCASLWAFLCLSVVCLWHLFILLVDVGCCVFIIVLFQLNLCVCWLVVVSCLMAKEVGSNCCYWHSETTDYDIGSCVNAPMPVLLQCGRLTTSTGLQNAFNMEFKWQPNENKTNIGNHNHSVQSWNNNKQQTKLNKRQQATIVY